jgi:hypothetical protein
MFMQGKIAMQNMHVFAWRKTLHLQSYASANKGNNKITELRTILQRESQNS